ncbi:MAG: hypothetical protein J07AB43_05920 [Candidatus Nanosalina sp. J07AB43]|jgi:hypothetical protein|nr:MAG: hypothetical protein J07AB43_05920 [Candidatus Nanosalina sp. J07AB43]
MRVLTDDEDEKFRKEVREKIGFHHEPAQGWEPLEIGEEYVVEYEQDEDRESKALDAIGELNDSLYILAFESGQYVPKAKKTFKEDMKENVVEVSFDEVECILNDLVIVYVLPRNMEFIVLFDHDGNIHFSGKIISNAKRSFN